MKSKLQTSISPDYVKGWDMGKAVRELIQNYLDSKQEFNCDGYLKWENGQATIKDYGPGLELRHFAMGISEKSSTAKGKYGEGLKLSLLTMARKGVPVELWTKGNVIKPTIEYNEAYQTDLLAFEIEPLKYNTHKGTTIKFECTEDEFERGKSYFIDFFKRSEPAFEWVDQDLVSLPGGYVFVNGTRVGELENSLFSYHLDEERVGDIGNRDREVIDMNKVSDIVSTMYAESVSSRVLELVFKGLKQGALFWEEANVNLYSWHILNDRERIWKMAGRAVFGQKAVFPCSNSDANSNAAYLGYELVYGLSWSWQHLLSSLGIVPYADAVLKNSKPSRTVVAQKDLDDLEKENLAYARRIVKKYYAQDHSLRIQIVENLEMVSGGTSQRVMGAYDFNKKRISIDRSALSTRSKALFVLLHEAVHQISGYADCTAEFENALLDIGVKALMRLDDCQEK